MRPPMMTPIRPKMAVRKFASILNYPTINSKKTTMPRAGPHSFLIVLTVLLMMHRMHPGEEGAKPEDEGAPHHVEISINLLAALGKLLIQLQHLADFASIGVAGIGKVEEADYKASPFFYSFQIAAEHRIPYPQIKDEFSTWCIKNSFTEAIDILSIFLEECRLIAALYALGPGTISGEA